MDIYVFFFIVINCLIHQNKDKSTSLHVYCYGICEYGNESFASPLQLADKHIKKQVMAAQ